MGLSARKKAYLQAMGITPWQKRHAVQAETTAAQMEHEPPESEQVVAPPVSPSPVEKHETAEAQQAPILQDPISRMDWQTLQSGVQDCRLCTDLVANRTQTVFGVGNREAQLMVIGEAPGADEDRKGEPFVGRAGQLLTKMLAAIGYRRDEVYIANVLKCRPPNNRDPHVDELLHCNGYLQRQIELIQPRAILVVGRIAAQHLLHTDQAIGRLRTQSHSLHDIPLTVTYHPAYLLRKPTEKRKVWADIRKLAKANQTGH